MIQQLKLLLIVFASCIVVDSYAQKVVVDGAGRVIIDASAIPNTTMPKARTTDATLYDAGTNTLTNISSELSNEKVFRTFEVLKNLPSSPKRFFRRAGGALRGVRPLLKAGFVVR